MAFIPAKATESTDRAKSHVSQQLDTFFIHVEEAYLDDKKLTNLSAEDRISLLGYALGRQAPNVQEIQEREEYFELLERDIERYCAVLAEIKHPGVVNIFYRDKYTTELWRKAQASMMGFYEEELLKTYGFDQWGIPNIFEALDSEEKKSYDPNSLEGKWISEATKDEIRFVSEGDLIRGYIAAIGNSYTLSVGELFAVFRKTGSKHYVGKLKMKTSTGDETWIEGFEINLANDVAFIGHKNVLNPVRYSRIW